MWNLTVTRTFISNKEPVPIGQVKMLHVYFIPYKDDSSSYEKRQVQYIASANSKAKVSNEQGIFNKHKKATALVILQANNLQCKYTCC